MNEINYHTNKSVRRMLAYINKPRENKVRPKTICSMFWYALASTIIYIAIGVGVVVLAGILIGYLVILSYPVTQFFGMTSDLMFVSVFCWTMTGAMLFDIARSEAQSHPNEGIWTRIRLPTNTSEDTSEDNRSALGLWLSSKKNKVCWKINYDRSDND